MRELPHNSVKRFFEFWWGDIGLSSFLLLLFLLVFLSPFIESSFTDILFSIFLVFLLISGVATVTERKFFRFIAWVVAGVAFVFSVLHHIIPSRTVTAWWYFSAISFFFLLIGVLLKRVFRDGPVTGHRIRGAIAVYLLIGIAWAFMYELIALLVNGAFSFPAAMTAQPGEEEHQAWMGYFSFVTMATLGYGDIVPVHPLPRMLAISEALIGQLYPATLLARLVSLEIIYRNERGDKNNTPKESGSREDH